MRGRNIARGALVGAAVLIPATAQAAVAPATSGVVVNYRAQSTTATVATSGGQLLALHTGRVRAGSRVRVSNVRQLANGTLAGKLNVTGTARRATVSGVVAARIGRRAIALSGPGTTFMIRLGRRATKSALQVTPQYGVGSTVKVDVAITPKGDLMGDDVTVVTPTVAPTFELEGMVKAIGTGTTAPTVDPTSGCVTGLSSTNLPVGWMAVRVGEHDLSLTAFVKLAATTPVVAPTTTPTTTTTGTTPVPPVVPPAPTLAVGQEIELHVSQILGTNGVACDNQFQAASSSQNGDEQEADDDGEEDGGHHGGGDHQSGGDSSGGGESGGHGGGDGGGNDD